MVDNISDAEVGQLVKYALEFNAEVLVLCTAFYGAMDTKRNQDRFKRQLSKIYESYSDAIKLVLDRYVEDFKE